MRNTSYGTRSFAGACHKAGAVFFVLCLWNFAHSQNIADRGRLFLLAADIDEPVVDAPASNANLFSVSADGQLHEEVTILGGKEIWGQQHEIPEGVYSVHDAGPYLLVEYPYLMPCCVIFVPKKRPLDFVSINFDPQHLGVDVYAHGLTKTPGGAICDLWPLISAPSSVNDDGRIVAGKMTLRSVCMEPDAKPFLETDQWSEYKRPYFDGTVRPEEIWLMSDVDGKLVEMTLGGPTVEVGAMPAGFPLQSRPRGVLLKAANERYLVISVGAVDGHDRDSDVFVRFTSNGDWKRLPVPAVADTATDAQYYRLFDDWLVTSASASLLAALPVKETVVPEVLTVIPTGKQWADWGIEAEPSTSPDVATLPARRITLWNLADGRRIDLAVPEDDSEVAHVFDNTVLLRIHDKLFFAEIEGSKLTGYKLAAFDSAIPQVHWAFYSQDAGN